MKVYAPGENELVQLKTSLATFERQFHYPLGENQSFSISHGEDYTAFYRSMGKATCLMAKTDENKILGTFCASLRYIQKTDKAQAVPALYLGDLKIDVIQQKTRLFYQLAKRMSELVDGDNEIALSVMMDGTKNTPPSTYSGRVNFTSFLPISNYYILKFQATNYPYTEKRINYLTEENAFLLYQKITDKDYFLLSDSTLRSKMAPIWLADPEGKACGKLEDTEQAKRLITSDGHMLRSSHLSYFTFTDPVAGYALLLEAIKFSSQQNFLHTFIALNQNDFDLLSPLIKDLVYDVAPATLYGNIHATNLTLQLNTAEI